MLAAVSILCGQGAAILDDDPATNASMSELFAAFCLIGLGLNARDNKVTSENAGATPTPSTLNGEPQA
jgi:hypothetical protein